MINVIGHFAYVTWIQVFECKLNTGNATQEIARLNLAEIWLIILFWQKQTNKKTIETP